MFRNAVVGMDDNSVGGRELEPFTEEHVFKFICNSLIPISGKISSPVQVGTWLMDEWLILQAQCEAMKYECRSLRLPGWKENGKKASEIGHK